MRLSSTRARRWAFTLIEMLVVVALILIMLTIAAAMFPRFAESQRITKGADQISQTLLIAKQRALRDRKPTGIRFILDASGATSREMVYIQQIDDYTRGYCEGGAGGRNNPISFTANALNPDGVSVLQDQPDQAPVQYGDYLEVNGGGLVHMINWVISPNQVETVSGPVPRGPYRIIRQPRKIAGERPVELPQNIVIDISRSRNQAVRQVFFGNSTQNPRPSQNFLEILFEPGGRVTGKGTTSGENIILWVRDITRDDATMEGSPLLVSIHTRTGMIAVHPVNVAGPDFYSFTKDGRSSGL